MGSQFVDEPDDYQKVWNDIFIDAGADMVLNDHTHSVQPIEVIEGTGNNKMIVNCPGNFVNSYRENNGDAAAMVEIYVDKKDKTITGASIIPMWIQAPVNGNYRPLPLYDILNNEALKAQFSTYDIARVEEVQRHVTSVMLGEELTLDMINKRYYMNTSGFLAPQVERITLTDKMKVAPLYQAVMTAGSVCYVGDSVTEGSTNGGYGWYEPIVWLSKKVTDCSKGGATTKTILPKVQSGSSLYVVAIGTNDVRYRDKDICAMTADDYIAELQKLVSRIQSKDKDAQFAFIAPWMALENDTVSAIPVKERDVLIKEYTVALGDWCAENGFIFSDPNPAIAAELNKKPDIYYMLDFIHPNKTKGIELYCKAVFESSVC